MNIKITQSALLGMFAALTLAGCEITEIPYNKITQEEVETNVNALEAVTSGNYAQYNAEAFVRGFYTVGDYASDNVALSGSTTSHVMFIYNFQRNNNNSFLSNFWGMSYKVINNANNMLLSYPEGVDKKTDHMLAENYFMRGFNYFNLSNTFGALYTTNPNGASVPLKTSNKFDDYPDRATTKQVYAQVVKDLIKADELFMSSGITKQNIFATGYAAKALLSRVYLYMGDQESNKEVVRLTSDVISKSGKSLLPAAQVPFAVEGVPEANPEVIFAIRAVKDKNNLGYGGIGGLYCTIDGVGYGEMYVSQPMRDAFAEYPDDNRSWIVQPQYTSTTDKELLYIEKYSKNGLDYHMFRTRLVEPDDAGGWKVKSVDGAKVDIQNDKVLQDADGFYVMARFDPKANPSAPYLKWYVTIQNVMSKRNDYPKYFMVKLSNQEKQAQLYSPIILRLAEMYLNRAEAYCKLGQDGLAIADLNKIRNRAGLPDFDPARDMNGKVTVDGTPWTLLDVIIHERRKEFAYEGQRKFDLLRNKMVIDRHYPGTHDLGAAPVVRLQVRYNDPWAVEYIPQREIDAYPTKIKQND